MKATIILSICLILYIVGCILDDNENNNHDDFLIKHQQTIVYLILLCVFIWVFKLLSNFIDDDNAMI